MEDSTSDISITSQEPSLPASPSLSINEHNRLTPTMLWHTSLSLLKLLRKRFRYILSSAYLAILLVSLDGYLFRGQDPDRDELTVMRPFFIRLNEMRAKSLLGFKYDLAV